MKVFKFFIPLAAMFALTGCDFFSISDASTNVDSSLETTETGSTEHSGSAYDFNEEVSVKDVEEITVEEATGDFEITTEDGVAPTLSGKVYTISAAGTYSLSGKLNGQVLVNAGDEDEVILELNGVSITYDSDSPIKVLNASKVEISAKKDTENLITDSRSKKTVENANLGEGAISADSDLKLKGSGTLVVVANYNNGVHSTKDLTIQKETLKVTGYNNAIKGKNSVTIESGTIQAYAKNGNGIKTEESDLTSKNKQKGTITISGGSVYVDSLHDAIDASYDVVIEEADETVPTSIQIVTGSKSTVVSGSFTKTSEKGVKAANSITISSGTVVVSASDDAIHANYGDTLGNGSKGLGNVTINGGKVLVASGDDGIHSDNTLTIAGGIIKINNATEGLEGNYIVITGGETYVYGSDDGVNASKKSFSSCSFTMSGGYLDVAVSNGDTDGIDSNGNFTLSGGIIVTRGAPGTGSGMSTGLDVDVSGICKMTGGTLIAFNGLESSPTISSGVYYAGTSGANSGNGMGGGPGGGGGGHHWSEYASSYSSSYSFQAGKYTLSGTDVNISFTNDYSYTKFCVYSSSIASGATYTLSRDGSSVVSWTQSSNSVTI